MTSNQKSFISALAVGFIDNFGYSLVFILFAPLILNPEYGFFSNEISEGTKNILLGLLIGVFPLFLFFTAPFWGDIGDRWGRKKSLILTLLGTVLGHLLSAFAIFLQSYLFLLIARAIAGFFSGNISLCLATVSDVSPDGKTKARNFGILSVFLGIGWISAMFVGGYLSDPTLSPLFSPFLPFYLVALITFIGFLIVKWLFVETHERHPVHFDWMKSVHEIKSSLEHPAMRPFFYALFAWSLGWFFTFQWFAPVSLEQFHVTQETVSSYLVILGICWVIGGVFLNPLLLKKISSTSLSLFSILFTVVCIVLSSLSSHYLPFSLFFSLSALSAPVSLSNILNLVSASATPSIQGKAMGFTQSFQALGGAIVPFLGGVLANYSIASIFPTGAALLFISCLILAKKRN